MKQRVVAAIVLGIVATVGLLLLEARLTDRSGRIVGPSSEDLMQTVSVADLRLQPWQTLLYLHIQPPLFDALRAALVHTVGRGQEYAALVVTVDRWLLRLWALVYGATVGLVCLWLADLCESVWISLVAAALWALTPPMLLYPTCLGTDALPALGMLWCLYELWRGRSVAAALATIFVFLMRSHFQWPFALLMAGGVLVRGAGRRKTLLFLGIVLLVMLPMYIKQWVSFRMWTTSSFFGYNACRSLGVAREPGTVREPQIEIAAASHARALTRFRKPSGHPNYNQVEWLRRARQEERVYWAAVRGSTLAGLLNAWATNAWIFLQPSSSFARSPVTAALPWRATYDRLSSRIPLLVLCLLSCLLWLWRAPWRVLLRRSALALPVLYVACISILFERGDNMRYRFFIEPILFVLVVASACEFVRRICSWRRRLPTGGATRHDAGCAGNPPEWGL
jgi:hypothetical protein